MASHQWRKVMCTHPSRACTCEPLTPDEEERSLIKLVPDERLSIIDGEAMY
jgi:hypothetical protein